MTNLFSSVILEDIDVKENEALLEMINAKNNNLQLEFSMGICDIEDLFRYYINKFADHIEDIDNYDCINIEIKKDDDSFSFTLNPSDDEEDLSDVKFLDKELKRYFGKSILNCDLKDVLRILLMDCKSYSIENDVLKINIYYENFKETWIGNYLNSQI